MVSGNWFITPHAVRKFMQITGYEYNESLSRLLIISSTAKFVKVLPSGFSLYRQYFRRSTQVREKRKQEGKVNNARTNLGLVIAPSNKEGQLPQLVTVLYRNPYKPNLGNSQ